MKKKNKGKTLKPIVQPIRMVIENNEEAEAALLKTAERLQRAFIGVGVAMREAGLAVAEPEVAIREVQVDGRLEGGDWGLEPPVFQRANLDPSDTALADKINESLNSGKPVAPASVFEEIITGAMEGARAAREGVPLLPLEEVVHMLRMAFTEGAMSMELNEWPIEAGVIPPDAFCAARDRIVSSIISDKQIVVVPHDG